MNSKRFIPLDVRSDAVEQVKKPQVIVVKKKPQNDAGPIIIPAELDKLIDDTVAFLEEEKERKKQQIIVGKQNDTRPIIIPVELDKLINDDVVAFLEKEKRRKQRQRIKRKKANKRRYQKMLWVKRYRYKK